MSLELVAAKSASAAGGLFGGLTMFAFMRPKSIMDATIRGGVCTGSAIIFAPIICDYIGTTHTTEHLLAAGAVIGFCAWSFLTLCARMLLKIQDEKTEIKLPEFIKTKYPWSCWVNGTNQ